MINSGQLTEHPDDNVNDILKQAEEYKKNTILKFLYEEIIQ